MRRKFCFTMFSHNHTWCGNSVPQYYRRMAITTTSPILKQTEGEVHQWAVLGKKISKKSHNSRAMASSKETDSQKGTWQWWILQLRMKIPGCEFKCPAILGGLRRWKNFSKTWQLICGQNRSKIAH